MKQVIRRLENEIDLMNQKIDEMTETICEKNDEIKIMTQQAQSKLLPLL